MDRPLFSLELTHPLRLVCLAALPILSYYFYRSLVDFPRWQRGLSLAIRSLVVLLLVLSMAGLTLVRPTKEQFILFAVDQSASIGAESAAATEKFLSEAIAQAGSHKFAVLPFAKEPSTLRSTPAPTRSVSEGPPENAAPAQPDAASQGTNIEAALEAALASLPPGYVPSVVLVSDGNETAGDALKAALRGGVPISTLPLPTRTEPEVHISSVNLPAQVRQGEPFYVEVVIDANHDDEGLVEVFKGSLKLDTGEAKKQKIVKGENRFRFRQTVDTERLVEFSVRVEGFQDTLLDNNEA